MRVYLKARDRYYDEETRRHRKPGATVFVDKMPLRSAEAGFTAKVFPDKRYIFSIRHPFDVVLSCFKQYFGRNIALEHFRSFEGAVNLYDFTMQQWFGAYGWTIRASTTCATTRWSPSSSRASAATLDFLGLPWDDKVLDFAAAAANRARANAELPEGAAGAGDRRAKHLAQLWIPVPVGSRQAALSMGRVLRLSDGLRLRPSLPRC